MCHLCLILADDVVVSASSSSDLQRALEDKCEAAGMRISTSKPGFMVHDPKKVAYPVRLSGKTLIQVKEVKFEERAGSKVEALDVPVRQRSSASSNVRSIG